jgi:predicted KAP-like P-loop ATPase
MPNATPHNDTPITQPSDDRFGIDPFAKALANSIRALASPEGTVIALSGPWGSGKSSAVNLVLHHLNDNIEAQEIVVIKFTCWWFRGEEALALAFFRELYSGMGSRLGERFKRALPKLGALMLRAGAIVGPGIDLVGGAGAGALTSGAMSWLSGLIQTDETVEKLHSDLTKALCEQDKRFVIVIDDIDRLAPDEALLIFRLVKSIGRLPNVVYLLVFDRQLAEKIVAEKYPSEGPHYLEKIIQAGFDIPQARHADLCQQLLGQIDAICSSPQPGDLARFMNIFYDVTAPQLKTPRDLVRLTNTLSVTWPAVGHEVDRADFIAVETLRLLRPNVYRAIRANKDRLCGVGGARPGILLRDQADEYDHLFLASSESEEHDRLRRALKRLFPLLEAVWGSISYNNNFAIGWARQRRICSKEHFDSYFRFTIGDQVLPKEDIDQFVERAGDHVFITETFQNALTTLTANGSTKAALLLDELNVHAATIADKSIQPLITVLFRLADKLDVPSDKGKGFSWASNKLRIMWLLRRLVQRFDPVNRSTIFLTASETASLGWLVYFAHAAYSEHHQSASDMPHQDYLLTPEHSEALQTKALDRIRSASKGGNLEEQPDLGYLLYRWRDLAKDDGTEVKRWTDDQLSCDKMIITFAKAFTAHSWSQAMGDVVVVRSTQAIVANLDTIMDRHRFRNRVAELAAMLAKPDAEIVQEFLAAWERQDANPGAYI